MARKNKTKVTNAPAQSFAILAPTAMTVQLAGDFTHWQERPVSLKKDAGGVWRAEVELSPGTHHYRFIVDGAWTDDPDCAVRVPNPYGGENMVRTVG
jgi:1,4-alpha-glucan branching enzyme